MFKPNTKQRHTQVVGLTYVGRNGAWVRSEDYLYVSELEALDVKLLVLTPAEDSKEYYLTLTSLGLRVISLLVDGGYD